MNDLFNFQNGHTIEKSELNTVSKIEDIEENKQVRLYAKIDQLNCQMTKNNTEFLNIMLMDRTGMINAKKWDASELDTKMFKSGQVVYLEGKGSKYNDKLQFIIESIRLVNESEDIDLSEFYESAPLNVDYYKKQIYGYINRIENRIIKLITENLVRKFEEAYFVFPAATRNHHAYISGLAHHVTTMLKLAENIGSIYSDLNLDLLYAGVILHDIGKVIELSDYKAPEYTPMGKLIGHLNIGATEIQVMAKELGIDSEEIMLLQHLVLSHHGHAEWGSPKEPLLKEAEILHFIDLIDSRINMVQEELDTVDEGEFTKRIYSMNGRAFYKPDLK
ncbi:3'-5' exoribonuclease YhaM family protein [Haloplasma contractile]|uniref:3'-5' exoribonuclease YhaM protein n=1 Tax=Haloplasma contractile SSD-17B TaxID=1033810 RepID=U2E7C9_9MOLU|nr:HD domain-containing protein [Haloplasma contractile]ERJ11108.1 3'-5' exoribonuclease YhaM protein [Haloplasma contractile SSD-17B]